MPLNMYLKRPPFISGPDVAAYQRLLHNNVFGQDYFRFPIDGVFGPITAQRTSACKWWLGYSEFSAHADALLEAYLQGKKPLPVAYRKRRAERLAHPKPKPPAAPSLASAALAFFQKHMDWHETPPGSNHSPATVLWGHGSMPWCNVMVSEAYLDAFAQLKRATSTFNRGEQRFQYVPQMKLVAEQGGHGLRIVKATAATRGDIIIFGSAGYHTALFDNWLAGQNGSLFWDVGGNEGASGVVQRDIHSVSACPTTFIHVVK